MKKKSPSKVEYSYNKIAKMFSTAMRAQSAPKQQMYEAHLSLYSTWGIKIWFMTKLWALT